MQLPKMAADYREKLATYNQMVPKIQALERRLAAIESNDISIESLFAENPGILLPLFLFLNIYYVFILF